MPSPDFETVLKRMELHLAAFSSALLSNEAPDLEMTSASMLEVSRDLGRFVENNRELRMSVTDKRRIQTISRALAAQRKGVLRRAATVEQSLGSLVPATRKTTYAGVVSPFGSSTRQSGAFKLLSA